MSDQRLPTAKETIIDGLIKHRKQQIDDNYKIENAKSDILRQFNAAQNKLLDNFYSLVTQEIIKTGKMPSEISVDSDTGIDLFEYDLNKKTTELYDIFDSQSNISCQQVKTILTERGFKIKSVEKTDSGWMKNVERWEEYYDTRYKHGCKFVLGSYKDYCPDI